jgi:single-strand DNA-binding protein
MIRAAIHGRIGGDPVQRETRAGKPMCTASIAVDVAKAGEEAATEWFSIVAFGAVGDALARHVKGDLISAMGPLTRSVFTARDGQERMSWSLLAESVLSARPIGRPRARAPGAPRRPHAPAASSRSPGQATALPNEGVDDLYADGRAS